MSTQSDSEKTVEAEVLESEVISESTLKKILVRAGRSIAAPALEAYELLIDSSTPPQVRLTMLAALIYLILPIDLIPDLIPIAGFSDDVVALTFLLNSCRMYVTPAIRQRAINKLNNWIPL